MTSTDARASTALCLLGWRRLTLTLMTKQEAVELRELDLHLRSVFDRAPV
ncbi:hypothetical protein BH24ACT10_BH24ACT10_17500 [soil metagenome]